MNTPLIAPFVKWAGGKRQLMKEIKERMPDSYHAYYEPFVGGGAVIFGLLPQHAVINDINKALIHTYRQISRNPDTFLQEIHLLDQVMWEDGKAYYYFLREEYNRKLMHKEFDAKLAALFVFINKHCFNGLYRVNKKGLFNVPYNNSRRESCSKESIKAVSAYLKGITILEGDFESACINAEKGDFIFFDSPYAPLNPTSFASYTKEGFSLENHKRLARLFDELTEKGCYCMLTNHNTDLIHELYGGKNYEIDVIPVKRLINSDADNRVGEEVIICNYKNKKNKKQSTNKKQPKKGRKKIMSKNPNIYGGGSQTNKNGLAFEQTTSLDDALVKAGYVVADYQVYANGEKIGMSVPKYSFYREFLEPHGINYANYNSKKWLPDEAFVNERQKIVYIIEKKFQNVSGSVDEKLPNCYFKKMEYEKLCAPIGYQVKYLHVLSDWFLNPKYEDILNYINNPQMGCTYFYNEIPLNALGLG